LKSEEVAFWPPYKEGERRHHAAQIGEVPEKNWQTYRIKV